MFHWTELGRFGKDLPQDCNGFVPEEEDTPELFEWDHREFKDEELWWKFVDCAIKLTEEATERFLIWKGEE